MRKALLAFALAFGLFETTSAQLEDHVMYDYGVLWNETMGFLRRDGGNTITGNLNPDTAGVRFLGDTRILGGVGASIFHGDASGIQIFDQLAGVVAGIRVSNVGGAFVGVSALAAPNSWRATAFSDQLVAVEGITQLGELAANTGAANYAMGSTKLTGLTAGTASGDSLAHSLNPLNHLSTATAAYDMGGFGFSNWTGATSSNFAQIAVISNRTAAAGAGINLRWNAAAALAAGYYPLTVQYDDATGTRDLMKLGYVSTSQSIIWLPDKDGGNGAGITEALIVAGESSNINSAGSVGLRFIPNSFSGALWVYVGGDIVFDIRNSSKNVSLGDGYALANATIFEFAAENSVTNMAPTGSYQFGYYTNLTPASGLQSAWLRGIAPGTQASTDFSNHIGSLDYLGQFRSGQHGDAGQAPADGGFSAAGWYEASTATNQTGADVYYRSGRGTGNSTTKGDIIFQTPDAGASGTTVQALTTKATIERDGDLALKAGTSTGTIAKAGGAITHSTTQVGNAALTETDLFSYSVPANTLETNGDSLDLFAGGTFTASASVDKRVRAYFGATTIFDTGALAITGATDWQLECGLIRSGAATQKSICTFSTSSATLSAYADYTAPGETLSGAVTLKVTGSGTLASDVVGELWKVLWSSAP